MSWNPDQYLRFADARLRPALDLLARVDLAAPARVVDLGCGAGNVTSFLARRWPQAQITGVDGSATMLDKARQAVPGVRWVHADMAQWAPDVAPDVLYSNAALHWLGQHERLFPMLAGTLAPGGMLAVQMPANFHAPSHTLMAETVDAGPWRQRLQHLLVPTPVHDPSYYFRALQPHVADIDIWQTEYLQVLTGPDAVKEWTKGTWLQRFLQALPAPDEAAAFEADYAARVRAAYPPLADGRTLFPFRRLFIVARR